MPNSPEAPLLEKRNGKELSMGYLYLLIVSNLYAFQIICTLCGTEQDVQQNCISCGVCMGKYFCSKCNFFDDDVSKNQYHCDECGICRTGGKENFFHCNKCGCCYSKLIQDAHHCVERAMHHNCPVCVEFLFDTMKDITVLPCGPTIHLECLKEMERHFRYSCPVCSKSICDMPNVWVKLDQEVASTPMPEIYKNKRVGESRTPKTKSFVMSLVTRGLLLSVGAIGCRRLVSVLEVLVVKRKETKITRATKN
ncbi:E3 ubiquitin-protein ligase RZFP34-like [Actinidia eriantha]|uniref:E3 ubiquitin-protein ligase RZFP34-like n=1 Tax=Actinidia eriantha TaxID=165200 RepID=UPI002585113A|nr:E3 ubiquitin-protein ligase RZFP34-like [Actinidia eriantha]